MAADNTSDTPALEVDRKELLSAAGAFLMVPMYMFMAALLMWPMMLRLSAALEGDAWRLWLVYLVLIGISWRAVQCIFYLKADPFRAVAVGRYVFAVYVLFHVGMSSYENWPSDKFTTPPPTITPLEADIFHPEAPTLHKMTSHSVLESKATWLALAMYGVGQISGLIEDLVLLLVLQTGYSKLRGNRLAYDFGNFLHDTSFGLLGEEYSWNLPATAKKTQADRPAPRKAA